MRRERAGTWSLRGWHLKGREKDTSCIMSFLLLRAGSSLPFALHPMALTSVMGAQGSAATVWVPLGSTPGSMLCPPCSQVPDSPGAGVSGTDSLSVASSVNYFCLGSESRELNLAFSVPAILHIVLVLSLLVCPMASESGHADWAWQLPCLPGLCP